jgi:anti-anti-sigma factor
MTQHGLCVLACAHAVARDSHYAEVYWERLIVKIDSSQHGRVMTIKPHGLLAGSDVDSLDAELARVLIDEPTDVILDISAILFVDSHGLEVLLNAAERLVQNGKTMKLAGPNRNLEEVLTLTELAPLFRIFPSHEAALESCA